MSGISAAGADDIKINILFIIDEIPGAHGGTEGQLYMLLKNLERSRFNPHFATLVDSPWLHQGHFDAPVTVYHLTRLFSFGTIKKILCFRRYCRDNKIDVIQTYFNDSFIFAAIAGRLAGVKNIIACRRNLGPGFWNRKSLLRIFRLLRRITKLYIANSQATKESIVFHEKIDPRKVIVIYNGLDLARFKPISEETRSSARDLLKISRDEVLVGMVAHLRPEKNIPFFIEAAASLAKKYSKLHFVVIGEGPLESSLRRQIEGRKLEPIFNLTGSVPDVTPYLPAFDIACLTSAGESFSNAIIEYQALGLPVVATKVGGNIEAVEDTGRLYTPGDMKTFIEAVSELIENESLRKSLGEKGRKQAVDKYSIEKMVRQHEAIYLDIGGL